MAKRATAAEPSAGYIHWGDDTLQISEARQALIDTVVDPAWAELNLQLLGPETNAVEALAAAGTPPFGGGGRLVIVSLEAADAAAGFLEQLAAEWESRQPLPGNALLVEIPTLDRRRKSSKWLEGRLSVRAFALPKAWDALKTLGPWVDSRLAARQGSITAEARTALIEAVGTDTWRLANEIDKLLLWSGEARRIDLTAVRALVATTESDVFGLLAALAANQKGQALIEAQRLLRDDPLPKLVAGLTTNLLLVKRAKTLVGTGHSQAEAASSLGVHPFRLQNLLREWGRWQAEHLQAALLGLAEVDRRSKQSAWPAALLLETWIMRFPATWTPLAKPSWV